MKKRNHVNEERDTYVIPPNFMEGGTVLGGTLKLRNALEAGVIALLIGLPVLQLPLDLTARIIVLCLTALPLAFLALIGISGESLSSFGINFFRYLYKRRVVYRSDQRPQADGGAQRKAPRRFCQRPIPHERAREHRHTDDFPDEFDDRERWLRPRRTPRDRAAAPRPGLETDRGRKNTRRPWRPSKTDTLEDYLPIEKIEGGVVYLKDGRCLKVLEVKPINFLLRSAREQRNVIYSFVSYLKISPVRLQIKALTKRASIHKHAEIVRQEAERESNPQCRAQQEDYLGFLHRIGAREAVTRRFFLIFEYEGGSSNRRGDPEDVLATLDTAAKTAQNYLKQCGNLLVEHDSEDEFLTELFYTLLNRRTSASVQLSERVKEVAAQCVAAGQPQMLDELPIGPLIAPPSVDFRHGGYVVMDGTYYAYLLVPAGGYRSQVPAGWLSLIVNAGEGVDMDLYLSRQPKDQVLRRLGQQLRINRSKIKESSDTNTDFDILEDAIQGGFYLKDGLGENQDFYYLNILVTVTAESEDELEWRVGEMKKLLLSQDMEAMRCTFRGEQAFSSTLPTLSLAKPLYEKSKRNALTLGIASCYPFVSFEISDDNGILLGVNAHNASLVITDIFNSAVYKSANISITGCTGAGKTFLLQLLALRLRLRGVQVFIIAPLKGHELQRACRNIGGSFIKVSAGSSHIINIMEIRRTDTTNTELLDGPVCDQSRLSNKIQQLHIFSSLLIPDMSYEERQLLDDAMIRTYAAKGITHDNASLEDPERPGRYKTMPILGDLHKILLESPDTKRLANILSRLVTGSARSFNGQTNVDLDNPYVVLDISELTGDLLTAGMFLALDFVWDKTMEDRTKEKAVFLDELWTLIGQSSNRMAADWVLRIAKIIRGYGGAGIFATQDISDYFSLDDGKYGRGVMNACKIKIVLNLEDDEAQVVQDVLHLSDSETMAITHFERGQGLLIANNNNIVVDFRSSELERELITTDRRELQKILSEKKCAMSS